MTSLTERESQALDAIAHGLAGSNPRLASMLNIFSRLAACPSPSIPRHADASHMMNLRLLAEAFPHGQSAGCAIAQLDPQARMIGNACTRTNGARGRRSAGYPPQALPSPTLDAKEYLSCTGTESWPCWPSPQLPAPW